MTDQNDELSFYDDGTTNEKEANNIDSLQMDKRWKIMIVDDEKEVHSITTLVLKNFTYDEKRLRFIHAYSAAEAKELITEHPDTAVILLDVVMETQTSGLDFVEYVRKVQKNSFSRIILRTGQPGEAPEEKVIVEYDINDYKEKTELSSRKLFTVMVSSLRTYRDILIIEENRKGLKRIIDASANLFELHSLKQLASGVLTQLTSILHLDHDAMVLNPAGFAAKSCCDKNVEVLAATGRFEGLAKDNSTEGLPDSVRNDLQKAINQRRSLYFSDRYVGFFKGNMGTEIVIYCEGWNSLSELNKNLIEIFCNNVHVAFENSHLNLELEETQKEIIYTLGEIAEARSLETGLHVKRVSEYSLLLGKKYGLLPNLLEILRLAAPMHDVGKVAIPDNILNSPGPLSDNDFQSMQTHAEIGSNMLGTSNRKILKAASIIAMQHHEKHDGTGYPNGLKGTEIHIYARITTIADVFDALCSDRVYRKAYTMPKVFEYFTKERGRHFDPDLLDLFIANIDEFIKIKNTYDTKMKKA